MKKAIISAVISVALVSQSFSFEQGKEAVCNAMHTFSVSILKPVADVIGIKLGVGSQNETLNRIYSHEKFGQCDVVNMIAAQRVIQAGALQVLKSRAGIEANIQNLCSLDGIYKMGAITIYVQGGRTTTAIYSEGALTQKIQSLYSGGYDYTYNQKADRLEKLFGLQLATQDTCMRGEILLERQLGQNRVVAIYDDKKIRIIEIKIPLRFDSTNEKIRLDEKLTINIDKLRYYLSEWYNYNVAIKRIKDNPFEFLQILVSNTDEVVKIARQGFEIVEKSKR